MRPKAKVQVWIFRHRARGLEVLLLKTTPTRGGFWQPVTGSVEERETPLQAALREAREETGLEFKTQPQPLGISFEYEKNGSSFHEQGFALEACESETLEPALRLDPREHVESLWILALDAIPRLQYDSNVKVLRKLIENCVDRS